MKPNCQRICDLLAQYADGTLSDSERAEVQRHLDACPPCQAIAGKECGRGSCSAPAPTRLRAEPVPPGSAVSMSGTLVQPAAGHSLVPPLPSFAIAALLIILTGSPSPS